MPLTISGHGLTIHDVERVARHGETVELSANARERVSASEALVQRMVEGGAAIYGVTTGIGEFARIRIDPSQGRELQENIIFSHAAGTGDVQPVEVVRAAMVARANTLAQGYSGIRLSTLQTYIELLNRGVTPVVYEKGSLGVSGDLSPLSQLALVVIGHGEAFYEGVRMPGAEAMRKASLTPVELTYKEGLGLINGTQMMTGESCLLLCDTERLYRQAFIAAAMTLEALKAVQQPFDARVHQVKPQPGQATVATALRTLLSGSGILADATGRVQDGYSLRCSPQVLGPSLATLEYATRAIETELNSAADNPLFFADDECCLAAGNFHGQALAMSMDFMAIATSEVASLAERHTNRLLNPVLSGLPDFLVDGKGLNSGLMVAQYTQAALLGENRVFCHPAVLDNVSVSADQEDHVCMGSVCVRKYKEIVRNTQVVIAIQLMCAAQALDFRLRGVGMTPVGSPGEINVAPAEGEVAHITSADKEPGASRKLSPATCAAYDAIRSAVPFLEKDRPMVNDIENITTLVREDVVLKAVEKITGELGLA
jgi:histidine ammonia-lyase